MMNDDASVNSALSLLLKANLDMILQFSPGYTWTPTLYVYTHIHFIYHTGVPTLSSQFTVSRSCVGLLGSR